jgi:hypothetical protein
MKNKTEAEDVAQKTRIELIGARTADAYEAKKGLGGNSLADDDHLLICQHRLGLYDHVFLDCVVECSGTTGKRLPD